MPLTRTTQSIPRWHVCAGCFASLVLATSSIAAQAAAPWRLVPLLRIDGAKNDLTFITAISVLPSGEILVAQPSDNSIKVFSKVGAPVRTIGRKGEGPGEFTGLGSIGFVGDTLYATDFRLRRVALFTRDGKMVRTIPMSPMNAEATKGDTMASRYMGLIPMRLSANNRALAIPSVSSADMAEGKIVALPVMRVGWDGAPQMRLALLPKAHGTLGIKHGSGATYMNQPFADDPLFAMSPSGERFAVVSGNPSAKVIRIVDISQNGDTIGTRIAPYVPERIASRVVDSVSTALQKMLSAQQINAEIRKFLYVPDHYAAASRALLADDGTVWLRTSTPADSIHRWVVVSPHGQTLAVLSVPKSTDLMLAVDGIWGTERDVDDVASVIHFHLERAKTP